MTHSHTHIGAILREPLLASRTEYHAAFSLLADTLMEGQRVVNLTAIRDPDKIIRYHLADSVALLPCISQLQIDLPAEFPHRAADIGTGGGFPLLPLAILWPHTQWTGIESVGKKVQFVLHAAHELKLRNVECLAERAETVGQGPLRSTFDLVTSRAVGSVSSLIEVSLPLLRPGGLVAIYKTASSRAEWLHCFDFLKLLGGEPIGEWSYTLEGDEQHRVIYLARKIAESPHRFPRANGVPFKKPYVPGPSSR